MINAGRWLVTLLYGLGGGAQLIVGMMYLGGWQEPELERLTVPPGSEELIAAVAGVVSILVGLVLGLTAWGIFTWRSWARIVAIVLSVLNLLALVVLSFQAPLTIAAIISGVLVVVMLAWLFSSETRERFLARTSLQ
ncbi:MAG: hypothetical protein ACE5IP_09670 [Terriglobia bacterium]